MATRPCVYILCKLPKHHRKSRFSPHYLCKFIRACTLALRGLCCTWKSATTVASNYCALHTYIQVSLILELP